METILCAQPDHAGMPKHYHLAGEYEARLQRLETFKTKVEQAMDEAGGVPEGLKSQIKAAASEADA